MPDRVPHPPHAPYITPRYERPYREEREQPSFFQRQELYEREKEIEREIIQQKKIWNKIKEEKLRELKLLSSELIGNIFERVKFLEERINDITASIQTRQSINKKIVEEITADIEEKMRRLSNVSDPNMIRDLQMDLNNLKMERRKEFVLFWKDILELQRELQQFREQYAIESKIAQLFSGLREDAS
ncbi:MAG: hypothetical protein QXY45_04515 [Candidatus Aenigmatarchaeota archaeon]